MRVVLYTLWATWAIICLSEQIVSIVRTIQEQSYSRSKKGKQEKEALKKAFSRLFE